MSAFPAFLLKSVEIKNTLENTRCTFPSTAPVGIPKAMLQLTICQEFPYLDTAPAV
jgi:hypothetical protein